MVNTPLKMEVNQTVFAVDGLTVQVCRKDQPLLVMPLEDIVLFAKRMQEQALPHTAAVDKA